MKKEGGKWKWVLGICCMLQEILVEKSANVHLVAIMCALICGSREGGASQRQKP